MINPENLGDENLESEEDEDDTEDGTELEEPELDSDDPVEILKSGREEMKNSPYINVLRKKLEYLRADHKALKIMYKLHDSPKKEEIADRLDKNKEESKEIEEKIQEVEDKIKKKMIDSVKKRRGKHDQK